VPPTGAPDLLYASRRDLLTGTLKFFSAAKPARLSAHDVSPARVHPYKNMMGRLLRAVPLLCTTLALGVAGSMALPAAAFAGGKGTVAPPGNSGVSQYVEDVPTVKGGKPTNTIVVSHNGGGGSGHSGGGTGSGSSGGSGTGSGSSGGSGGSGSSSGGSSAPVSQATISPAVTKKLNRSGKAGKSAAALAQATAPIVTKQKPHASKPPAAASTQVLNSLEGSAGGGGMGAFLPIFLIASLVLVSAVGIFHRRRTP
jgi:hypothetical protein